MSVLVNVHMSKIMRTPIKLGVRTYAKYANCRTLNFFFFVIFSMNYNILQLPARALILISSELIVSPSWDMLF